MTGTHKATAETERLESLWAGDFGNAYVDRNSAAGESRKSFWDSILSEFAVSSALEIGCNLGANLEWIAQRSDPSKVFGVDVNAKAIAALHRRLPGVNAVLSPARYLPFRDRLFDLTFTTGVLIHQPEATLPLVMTEIVRCSNNYVLCGEYYADEPTEVPYRGETGALFKRDYGAYYLELFPELRLVKKGFLGKEQGWDDVTWWLFERR